MKYWVIANDQGYLPAPVTIGKNRDFSICPGERIELLVDFGNVGNGVTAFGDATVFLVNHGAAPFPFGIPPAGWLRRPDLNVIMRFDVRNAAGKGIRFCGAANAPKALTWDPAAPTATNLLTACMPVDPTNTIVNSTFVSLVNRPGGAAGPTARPRPGQLKPIVRHVYLNERLDGVTLMPLGMQLNGVPFEYKVTETPNVGTREVWKFINLTVDTHPMHPHLVKHQIVRRDFFDMNAYKTDLCGSMFCQPGPAPGNEMQVVPDIDGISPSSGLAYIMAARHREHLGERMEGRGPGPARRGDDHRRRLGCALELRGHAERPWHGGMPHRRLRWAALDLRARDLRAVRVALPHQLARGLGDDAHEPRRAVAHD